MAEGTYVVIRRSVGLLRSSYALVERFDDRAAALLAANRLNAAAASASEGACFVVLVAPPHLPELDRVWSQDSSLSDGSRAISSYLGTRWCPVR
jgi:hypothetical protein